MILLLQLFPVQPQAHRQEYVLPVGTHVPPFRQGLVEQAFDDSATHTYMRPIALDPPASPTILRALPVHVIVMS